jgi:hypothetical protein
MHEVEEEEERKRMLREWTNQRQGKGGKGPGRQGVPKQVICLSRTSLKPGTFESPCTNIFVYYNSLGLLLL